MQRLYILHWQRTLQHSKTLEVFDLKVFKAWVRGFFQGKMLIRNISGYKDIIETKFGTWTDFTVLNIFKSQWHFVWSRDMSRDTFP